MPKEPFHLVCFKLCIAVHVFRNGLSKNPPQLTDLAVCEPDSRW